MSELPHGWIRARFSQLFDFKGGSQPPKATFCENQRPGYVRLLQIRDFESDAKAVFIKDHPRWPKCAVDDIMIGRYGASVGKILTGKAGAYNVALVRMIFERELLDASWVRLFLLSDHFQDALKRISRSAQNGFNKPDLEEIQVPLAPLPEQRRIVAKIASLSAKSKRARDHLDHIPRLVEKYKQAILAAAFGAVDAEARIGDIAFVTKLAGFEYTKSVRYADDGDVPVVKAENVAQSRFDGDLSYVRSKEVEKLTRSRLVGGEVLMVFVGSIGKVAICPSDRTYFLGPNVALIRPDETKVSAEFLLFFLKSDAGLLGTLGKGKATAQGSISMGAIRDLIVPLPTLADQQAIINSVRTAYAWIDRLASETTSARKLIDHLDQAILAKSFRGELVPQDPNDEPASLLLERIRAERQKNPTPRGRKKQQKAPKPRRRALGGR